LQAIAGREREVGRSTENAALLGCELISKLVRIDEVVALGRRQAAHAADRLVDGLVAIGRQLFELLIELAGLLFLIGSEMLPGFHAIEYALLLLWRQAGEMLQPVLQPRLLLWRKPAELGIVFKRAVLLRGWQVFIATEPVSGVARLIARDLCSIGTAGAGMTILLKVVPLPVRTLGGRRIPGLGERWRQQQKRRQTARNLCPAQLCPAQHDLPF